MGTQSISPFYWSIDSGALAALKHVPKIVLDLFGKMVLDFWMPKKTFSENGLECFGIWDAKKKHQHHVSRTAVFLRCARLCSDDSCRLADHSGRPLQPQLAVNTNDPSPDVMSCHCRSG